ncbi:protein CutA homolog isoform X1 [Talpa occidentalis]|uniref:protein CutA homolog isoform X1 n=1 Tax=Talpa occidentalis TaxID=50954 RepID=UPI00188E596E|nr:protein CutA homolog isoform X1 [Talpa occidentalis]XP_054545733.1 protein CutA homolog isoform X1 [Talpa occidentalis]
MDRLASPCPLPGYPRPSVLTCLLILTASFLTYPTLRTLSLQLHSAVTGSYISGTYSIVFVNCPNEQIARDIARAVLDKKLATSVNILPKASSLYFWNGEIEEATEILLLIKTKTSRVHVLSSYIREPGSVLSGYTHVSTLEPPLVEPALWRNDSLIGWYILLRSQRSSVFPWTKETCTI